MSTVVILGMHRSGTSAIAQLLHRAGLHLGSPLSTSATSDNLTGHWEAQKAVAINDHLLEYSGGSWFDVPRLVTADAESNRHIKAFLKTLARHQHAGFKDPRTTLTLPVWRRHLHDYRLVVCLRHPTAVARSLCARQGWDFERALNLWVTYNERLVELCARKDEPLFFDFDQPEEQLRATASHICHELGLEWSDRVWQGFNSVLRHSVSDAPIDNRRAGHLYSELRALATRESGDAIPPKGESYRGRAKNVRREPISPREEMLMATCRLQGEVIQQLDRRLNALVQKLQTSSQEAGQARLATEELQRKQQTALEETARWQQAQHDRLAASVALLETDSEGQLAQLRQLQADITETLRHLNRLEDYQTRLAGNLAQQGHALASRLDMLEARVANNESLLHSVSRWMPLRVWRVVRRTARAFSPAPSGRASEPTEGEPCADTESAERVSRAA